MHRLIFQLWFGYLAGMVSFGWLLTYCDAYRAMGIAAAFLVSALAIHAFRQFRNIPAEERREWLGHITYTPFLILLALIVLAGSLYTTAVLDSLSYRIPRMLLWMQEGGVHYIDNPDLRMNYMTPLWEFANTPMQKTIGLRGLWLGSAISWVLLYLATIVIARGLGAGPQQARRIAILCAACTGYVLQAPSTMNDIWAVSCILISLTLILEYHRNPRFSDLVLSGLALALATGAKPHFAVLALPWLLWFAFSPARPWKRIAWRWALPVGVLAFLVSPLPTFVINHIHYGSIAGPAGQGGFAMGTWYQNIIFGSIMMIWAMIQPPVNPFAAGLENFTESLILSSGIHEMVPRFSLKARELILVDAASIGLICSVVFATSFIIAWRHRRAIPRWTLYAAAAGLFGFLVAVSQVVPGTLGRSFLGFTALWIPLAVFGIMRMPDKFQRIACALAVLSATVSVILSPSHPLWPARMVGMAVPRLMPQIGHYLSFHERGAAGHDLLLEHLPPDALELHVFPSGDQSLVQLWNIPGRTPRILIQPAGTTLEELRQRNAKFILVIGEGIEDKPTPYPELVSGITDAADLRLIAKKSYISKFERGSEPWRLYRVTK